MLIPGSIQNVAIPLSAALMGIVAILIQWYGYHEVAEEWSHKTFRRVLILTVLALFVLIIVHPFIVATVKIGPEGKDYSFIVGFTRPAIDPCSATMSAEDCISKIGTDTSAIKSHWGDQQIALATLSLLIPYLVFMSSFGMMVGLLLLEEKRVRDENRARRATTSTPTPSKTHGNTNKGKTNKRSRR